MRMSGDATMRLRWSRALLGCVVVWVIALTAPPLAFGDPLPRVPGEHPFAEYVSSHPTHLSLRGGMTSWPQHTLFGYERALSEAQTEVLDLDLRLSADGIPVVIHDERVDNISEQSGLVSELTFAELKSLDAGYEFTVDGGDSFPYRGQGLTIPSLEEVLAALDGTGELSGGSTPFLNIELKVASPTLETQVVALLRRYDLLSRTCVGSIEVGSAARIKREEPGLCTFHSKPSALCMGLDGLTSGNTGLCPEHDVLEMPAPILLGPMGQVFLDQAFELGIPVIAVDPAEDDDIRALLELGVDGILDRDPLRLRAILAESN